MTKNGGEFKAVGKLIIKFEDGWGYLNIGTKTAQLHQSTSSHWRPQDFELDERQKNSTLSGLLESNPTFNFGELSSFLPSDISLKIKCSEDAQWSRIFEHLKMLNDEGETFSTNIPVVDKESSDRVPVPQTSLRRFYESLLLLRTKKLRKSTANYLSKEPGKVNRIGKVSKMIDQSIDHVARYINENEGFHPNREPEHAIDSFLDNREKFAKCLQARLRAGRELHSSEVVGFIDYEINPLRTTNHAVNDDGRVGTSGYGGLDLLLVNQIEKQPILIVGEVKAKTDTDLFLAFIQSLVYAIELGTENQFERLRSQSDYKSKLQGLDRATGLDIYLIFETHPDDVELYFQTRRFCELLLQYGNLVKKVVRKVKFVEATLEEDGSVTFLTHHVVDSASNDV